MPESGDESGLPAKEPTVVGLLDYSRAWNIALRTAHLATMGILLGGHAFDVPRQQLIGPLWLTVGTGVGLAALETGGHTVWFHQGRGLMTLAKLLLILAVPLFWEYRLPILLAVVVLASVGSHMPARFRYYSVLYGEVLRCGSGPGLRRLADDEAPEAERPPETDALPAESSR